MDYLKNGWYAAGFSEELETGKTLARTLLGQPIVFFRSDEGKPAALVDRCSHRFAPLSMGRVVDCGKKIECPYHGLQFDAKGQCVRNPHGTGMIAPTTHLAAYAVEERHGFLWWWAGDAANANPDLIPDISSATTASPDISVKGYLPTACDYRLLIDNILDLSHADYLHPHSLGGAFTDAKATSEYVDDRGVRTTLLAMGSKPAPALGRYLAEQGVLADQRFTVNWTAPSSALLNLELTVQGHSFEDGIEAIVAHIVTPESDGKCHYWYWGAHYFDITPEQNAFISGKVRHAFEHEDKPILEAQQVRMGNIDFWDLRPVLLSSDVGAVKVRRALDALIAKEASA